MAVASIESIPKIKMNIIETLNIGSIIDIIKVLIR